MKNLILGLLVFGFTSHIFAQVITLPEIEITTVNYKYLSAVDAHDSDFDVKMLEKAVAKFDVINSDYYSDEYDTYEVKFYIPDGYILAAYDANGNILRTIEKFNNVKLPIDVRDAVFSRFPNWTLKKDVYYVKYNQDVTRKIYKMIIEKDGKILRIKTDDKGYFLNEVIFK